MNYAFIIILAVSIIITLCVLLLLVNAKEGVPIEGCRLYDNPIKIDVSLKGEEGVIEVKGIIMTATGEKYIRFVLLEKDVRANTPLFIDGRAVLSGGDRGRVILMPCLIHEGMGCFRIQMLIPGYDVPLRISRGAYNLSLFLHWRSQGPCDNCRIKMTLGIVECRG